MLVHVACVHVARFRVRDGLKGEGSEWSHWLGDICDVRGASQVTRLLSHKNSPPPLKT